jgi:hypothetical protein
MTIRSACLAFLTLALPTASVLAADLDLRWHLRAGADHHYVLTKHTEMRLKSRLFDQTIKTAEVVDVTWTVKSVKGDGSAATLWQIPKPGRTCVGSLAESMALSDVTVEAEARGRLNLRSPGRAA